MSQFNKYIKIATEIINEANLDTSNITTHGLRALAKIIEKSENTLTLGYDNSEKPNMLGFISDFSDPPSEALIKRAQNIIKNKEVVNGYVGTFELTKNLVKMLNSLENTLNKVVSEINVLKPKKEKSNSSPISPEEAKKLNKKSNNGLEDAIKRAKPYK